MAARWLAPGLLLLAAPALHAHDGPPYYLPMAGETGPYKVQVWADPDVEPEKGKFFVYVEAPGGGSTEDVKVTVAVAPVSGRLPVATSEAERQVLRRQQVQYYAEVEFDQQEFWNVRVTVKGPDGGGELTAAVEATPGGLGRWDLLLYLSPFLLIAGLWAYGVIRHRHRRRQVADQEGEQGGDMGPKALVGAMVLAAWAAWPGRAPAAAPPNPPRPKFEALSNTDTWSRLPREEPPLPAWARVLARSMPVGTAHLLNLDHTHRARNPLDPALRGKLRWVAADTNRCDYAKAYAEYDLRRAGVKPGAIRALAGDFAKMPPAERAAYTFARKMSRGAYTVTDQEVAELLKLYGAEKVVAMVHTLAHANFQDRLFLALGVEVEDDGPYPPLELRVGTDSSKAFTPRRPEWQKVLEAKVSFDEVKPDWGGPDFDGVRKAVDAQKERKVRVPLPPDEKLAMLPEDIRERSKKIVWSHISMGYQPLLTRTWFETMGAASGETSLDPVFSNTLFWVVTRSSECFY